MADDSLGLSMTGSAGAVASYDRAVEHLIRFQPPSPMRRRSRSRPTQGA